MYEISVEVKVKNVGGHVSDVMFQHLEARCHEALHRANADVVQKRISGDEERDLTGLHVIMLAEFTLCKEVVARIELKGTQ